MVRRAANPSPRRNIKQTVRAARKVRRIPEVFRRDLIFRRASDESSYYVLTSPMLYFRRGGTDGHGTASGQLPPIPKSASDGAPDTESHNSEAGARGGHASATLNKGIVGGGIFGHAV